MKANPFVGEIRMFSFNFPPIDWALCDGSSLKIADFPELFNAIGTSYGGDGVTNFALPDLRGRAALGSNDPYPLGKVTGVESVALGDAALPAHKHQLLAYNSGATTNDPTSNTLGETALYVEPDAAKMAHARPETIGAPGYVKHNNMQPSLVLNYCIALTGIPTASQANTID